jgi:diguanylate cyclase (GGDEF)-like protein/PAS domain S-box-containing protein
MTSALPTAQALFDQMADAVYLLDPVTSKVLWANRAAWEVLGLSRDEVLDHSVLSLQMDVAGLPQWTDIAAVIRQQPPYVFVGRHRHRAGHEVPVEVVTTVTWLDGREFFLSVARDITRRLATDRELSRREQQLWYALNQASDGLWEWDLGDDSLFFSPQLKRMLGYGPDEMAPVLSTWVDNVHPEDGPRVMRILQDHLEGKRVRYDAEYRLRNRNGHYLWVHDRGQVCGRDEQGRPTRAVGMVQDITDRKLLHIKLEEQAAHDTLTGLPNRRRGEEFLSAQLALCERMGIPLGLCLIDLDRFKSVNDVHGHLKGDEVLRESAQALGHGLRRSDLIYRWGGEEFVIVCPNTGLAELQEVSAKARESLNARPWQAALGVDPVTASMGLAEFPRHGQTIAELMTSVDAALYRAKSRSRDCIEVARAEDLP